MGGVDKSAMGNLIGYAYTGTVNISTSTEQNLMMAASFLQVQSVLDVCADFIESKMTPDNVLEIKKFAEALNATSLVTASKKFIFMNIKLVSESKDFQALNHQQIFDLTDQIEDVLNLISVTNLVIFQQQL